MTAPRGDAEAWIERRHELACELVRRSDWGEIDYDRGVDPFRLLPEIRQAVSGLDALPIEDAAGRLAEAMRLLMQFVEELRYPQWAQGYGTAGYYRDECEELVANQNDDAELRRGRHSLYRDVRRRVAAIKANRHPANINKAGDLGLFLALLAVELDEGVVERVLG